MIGSDAVVALNCGCKTSGLSCKTSSLNVSKPAVSTIVFPSSEA
jgi:hypothetical protein